jgi:hypothetical protein
MFKSVLKEIDCWHWFNMITISVAFEIFETYEMQYRCLQYAFQNAIYEVRRNKFVDKNKFRYIRVNELFQSGYAHIHMLYSQFLPFTQFKYYLNLYATRFCDENNISYKYFNITSIKFSIHTDKAGASAYVTKYICKSFNTINSNAAYKKVYSKSRSIVFFNKIFTPKYYTYYSFDKNTSSKGWLIIHENAKYCISYFGLFIFRTSPQIFLWYHLIYSQHFRNLKGIFELPPESPVFDSYILPEISYSQRKC